jgi:hypothetical protein
MPLQIRFNHVLQLKKQPFNSGARTFRQVGRALILVWIGHSQFPSHSTIQNGFESTASAINLPSALFFLSQTVAQSLLFVPHIPADSNCPPPPSSSTRCLLHAQTFASVLPEMLKSSSMLFVLGYSLWSCNVLEVRSAWPYVLAAYTSGKSEAAVSPSLWNRASSASPREEVGVLRGSLRLNVLCGNAQLTV